MFDNHKLGAYILYLRKKRGMTQSQLAELLGISPQAVSNWERGESMPDIALLGAVARALGTTADKLLAAAENYEAAAEQAESPDEELERLKSELEETKRKVREAEERAGAAEKDSARVHVIHLPSWQEVSEKLPDFQEVAENARTLGKDMGDKAKEIFDAAQDFTRKRMEQVERYRRERSIRREQAEQDNAGADEEDEIDLSLINSLAPFASQEGVDTMLDALPAEAVRSLSELCAVSPFAGEEALGRLTRRVMEAQPGKDHVPGLLALAPHLRDTDLRDIVMDEAYRIAASKISRFAPFLQEKDIDELILRAAQRKKRSAETAEQKDEES